MSQEVISQTVSNALAITDEEMLNVLKSSLYPGATDESVKMVLSYCRAGKLDPMQKPVHIVPMFVKDKKTNQGAMRDVIMPGISFYRIQAARTGKYMGLSEPEFGHAIEKKFDKKTVIYPEWCKISVKIFVNGQIVVFSAKEFWLENYATAGKDTSDPNAMWEKRAYGQIAKCTEAQALRKAFPEIGSQPTAEEMEGKFIEYSLDEAQISPKTERVKKLINKNGSETEQENTINEVPNYTNLDIQSFFDDLSTAETTSELRAILLAARDYAKKIGDKALYAKFYATFEIRKKELGGTTATNSQPKNSEVSQELDESWDKFKDEPVE